MRGLRALAFARWSGRRLTFVRVPAATADYAAPVITATVFPGLPWMPIG